MRCWFLIFVLFVAEAGDASLKYGSFNWFLTSYLFRSSKGDHWACRRLFVDIIYHAFYWLANCLEGASFELA